MRRLYLQIYGAMLAALVLYVILAGVASFAIPLAPREKQALNGLAAAVARLLPPVDAPRSVLQPRLEELSRTFGASLTLRSPGGGVAAFTGAELDTPGFGIGSRWWRGRHGLTLLLELPDGRVLIARHAHVPQGPQGHVFIALVGLAIVVAAAAWPVARRLTRRLERLRGGVEGLGGGNLSARVAVEGADEVAELAQSFNRAADRIETLVQAQRRVLAGASHELRSPLARLQMAVELLEGREDLKVQVRRDVGELDDLIGELLLASRLEAVTTVERVEDVDLLALAAEEAARTGASVSGSPVVVRADERLLRRLVRNLLENGQRHAAGATVEIEVSRTRDGQARIAVLDAGPGVPEPERERIFEPFYRVPGAGESQGGVGLGLALVRQIARHHGGEASYLARATGGSCFLVVLPGA